VCGAIHACDIDEDRAEEVVGERAAVKVGQQGRDVVAAGDVGPAYRGREA
jgi:hypothetical protein